ncbi:MAG: pentapeptide repeat-containing protein [Roseofilum sp. SID2]|uniref:pentapeptide repeat-containing protein n=1 Tax=Roseofilum sp. SID2 TaxID=2821498 RepID=UPI001B2E60ED|nr:pentapeptide repeat-containing protein [Roseofilum sp. SID2]MBP0025451.1 pentapeptide repeat-containing protein [Roseofilum sp. SID2]
MNYNFSGANLQGKSFVDRKLEGSNFSHADLRGANFKNAKLNGADFSHVICGLPNHWIIFWLFTSVATAILAGLVSGLTGTIAAGMLQPYFINFEDYRLISGVIAWLVLVTFSVVTVWRGYIPGILTLAASVVTVLSIVGTALRILPGVGATALVSALIVVASLLQAIATGVGAVVTNSKYATHISFSLGSLGCFVGFGAIQQLVRYSSNIIENSNDLDTVVSELRQQFGALNLSRAIVATVIESERGWAILLAALILTILIVLGNYIGRQAVCGSTKFSVVRQLILSISSLGGTSFQCSDLTGVNFSYAQLKNSWFTQSTIVHTNWTNAKELEYAVVGESYLNVPIILQLLVTRNGEDKNFERMSLRGVNLIGANLRKANFIGADLGYTLLQGADLSLAKLVQTQLDRADLTGACLTGAFIQDWRISAETKLDNIRCEFIFTHLPTEDDPDTGRKPDNRNEIFEPGDFADFITPLKETLDLYHRQDIDARVIAIALDRLMDNHPEANLEIVAMERRGKNQDQLLIRAKVANGTDRSPLHAEYFREYKRLQSSPDQKLLSILADKDRQIQVFMGMIATTFKDSQVLENKIYVGKRVMLKIGAGNFETGFPLILQVGDYAALPSNEMPGQLPPSAELPTALLTWQDTYRTVGQNLRLGGRRKQIPNTSFQRELDESAQRLSQAINEWLNSEAFLPVREKLQAQLPYNYEIRVLIQTEDPLLRQLPWQLWNWFEKYEKAEVALSTTAYDLVEKSPNTRHNVRVLIVLGNSEGIDLERDRRLLEGIETAETVCLVEPQQSELEETLQDIRGWDILFFAGHSESQGDTGCIYINSTDSLTIEQLQDALQIGIEQGLKLAIFNSCDGLGLAQQLARLQIPQIIVMREPVPDVVAHKFLQYFMDTFAQGESLYLSVRQAREKLRELDNQFFCASWLPIICQNPAEIPWTWQDIRGVGQPRVTELLEQLQATVLYDPSLDDEDRVEALDKLQMLASAGQNLQEEQAQKLAINAVRQLLGMMVELSENSPTFLALNRMLPEIVQLLQENLAED